MKNLKIRGALFALSIVCAAYLTAYVGSVVAVALGGDAIDGGAMGLGTFCVFCGLWVTYVGTKGRI